MDVLRYHLQLYIHVLLLPIDKGSLHAFELQHLLTSLLLALRTLWQTSFVMDHYCWHNAGTYQYPENSRGNAAILSHKKKELWKYGWGNEELNAVWHATSPLSTRLRSYGVQQRYLSSYSPPNLVTPVQMVWFLQPLHPSRLRPSQLCATIPHLPALHNFRNEWQLARDCINTS
jgi:hypothetical protein